jgi:hypothetical protein
VASEEVTVKRWLVLLVWGTCLTAGSAPAADCARGGAPAATLLVPYFRVSRNGVTSAGSEIPDALGQVDTLLAITNVSDSGLVVRATVWNKYGVPVIGFNVPMTAKDVATFRMKDVLNGKLDVNPSTQLIPASKDVCGINQTSGVYAPRTGFGAVKFIRFSNPDPDDARRSISVYATSAFGVEERKLVWDSLDESGDVGALTSPGPFVVDQDNACGAGTVDGQLSGDFSGYVTFDVVNYCTSFFPTDREYWANDVLATAGWEGHGPNALIGDVFYIDSSANGNISGDPMVSFRFAPGLGGWNGAKTFYGRYDTLGDDGANQNVPADYRFVGDGREALGTHYAFRYLNDVGQGLRSWALVFRSDRYASGANDLCGWRASAAGGAGAGGMSDRVHELEIHVYDADENEFLLACNACGARPPSYLFLESQRIDLLNNSDVNPGGYLGGWIDVTLPGTRYGQAFVGVQHSGLGQFLSVGHSASLLFPDTCGP